MRAPRLSRTVLQLVDPATGVSVELSRASTAAVDRFRTAFRSMPAGRCYRCEVRGPQSRAVFPVSRAAVQRLLRLPALVIRRVAPLSPFSRSV